MSKATFDKWFKSVERAQPTCVCVCMLDRLGVCVCVSECIHMLRSNIYVKFMKYAQNIRYFGQFTRLLLQMLTELCTIVYFFYISNT